MSAEERIAELEVALGNLLEFVQNCPGDSEGSEQTGLYWSGEAWKLFKECDRVFKGDAK